MLPSEPFSRDATPCPAELVLQSFDAIAKARILVLQRLSLDATRQRLDASVHVTLNQT